ncbi:hypothetical protein F9L07_26150 [Pimelobacter simplex]|uniref:Restriction system protein n=2 Tax=Nocardioides simplex TaxID=2045 RepID=A0A7J5DS01_NOCSI|nr:hypothetical protein F9L07_26150 [Pimelobacter simplex]
MNYQAQQAEKRRRQQEAAAVRAHNAAVREAERRRREADRARAAAVRASEAERKAAEKEAARLHAEARIAEVEALNRDLDAAYSDIDSLLEWTLSFDDFVDLASLKVVAEHPPFEPGPDGKPAPAVPEPFAPPRPNYVRPPAPSGLSGAFGGKKRHAQEMLRAESAHQHAMRQWQEHVRQQRLAYDGNVAARAKAEEARAQRLSRAEDAYRNECAERESEAAARNDELAKLINDLAFDVEAAIDEYVGIVLSNSVYPTSFLVEHEHEFELATRELRMQVHVPEPSSLPTVREYRYVKARDEVTSTQLSAKAQKDRYASAVHQVAVRTLHEVFEADRAGKIRSIALTVGANHVSPATGRPEYVPLVVVAADRETFVEFDLRNVVPSATLDHLGAAVSKAPIDLVPADTSRGVRQRGQ